MTFLLHSLRFGKFQSTLPVRGATIKTVFVHRVRLISIHAPRAGSDEIVLCELGGDYRFQSTLPVRGATRVRFVLDVLLRLFQSTLPVRGATRERA